jgi:acyl carrier protein
VATSLLKFYGGIHYEDLPRHPDLFIGETMTVTEAAIIDYLKKELYSRTLAKLAKPGKPGYYDRYQQKRIDSLDENTMIIEEGIVDSFGLTGLIDFCEAKFSVKLPDSGPMVSTYATVKKIGVLIDNLKIHG